MILSIDVGIKNLAMCLYDPTTKKINKWEVAGVPPLHKDGIFLSMKKHLDERPWVLTSTTVLIEKQPDRNKGMKAVEHFLQAYFLVKDGDRKVINYDARFKIPDISGPGKEKYKERKQASVDRCREFLKETNNEWLDMFEKHKKKDDLADTVMQALSFNPTKETTTVKNVKPRKPTEVQKMSKYSKANLAWLVKTGAKQDARFNKDLARYYNNIEELKSEYKL